MQLVLENKIFHKENTHRTKLVYVFIITSFLLKISNTIFFDMVKSMNFNSDVYLEINGIIHSFSNLLTIMNNFIINLNTSIYFKHYYNYKNKLTLLIILLLSFKIKGKKHNPSSAWPKY